MAKGINKVILIGNLGKDPEVRYMPSGDALCNLTVATSDTWKDKQTGENKEQTEWHRVTFFGRLAEIAGEYLKKGSKVYIEGSLRTRKYTDNNGIERYATEVRGAEMQMLDSRTGGGATEGGYGEFGSNRSAPASAPSSRTSGGSAGGGYVDAGSGYGEEVYGSRSSPAPTPAPRPAPSRAPAAPSSGVPDFDEMPIDDDIPF